MKVKGAIVIAAALVIALVVLFVMQPIERVYIQPNGAIITQNRITGQLDHTNTRTIQREKAEAHNELEVERIMAFTNKDSSQENILYVKYKEEGEYRLSGRLIGMDEVEFYEHDGKLLYGIDALLVSSLLSDDETILLKKPLDGILLDAGYGHFFILWRDLPNYLEELPPRARKNLLKQLPEMAEYAKKESNQFRWNCLLYFIESITIASLIATVILVAKKTQNNRPAKLA